MPSSPRAKVYLVGAGPGDPQLLTLKAARLLAIADVVVCDALVSSSIRQLVNPNARVIEAGKRASKHTLEQEETNRILVEEAEAGRVVVRLKGGDPFVFGRGSEEAEELRAHGIDFEIVPGISSAIAGPAYAGIPVTHRNVATSVTLVTGHSSDETSGIDWGFLAKASGTLVFLMGLGRIETIARNLREHGMPETTPAAVIANATTALQRTVTGDLLNIAQKAADAKLPAPALIVVGDVVSLRQTIHWFETKPLIGRTVVVTRAREQASDFIQLLEERGANVVLLPMIEIAPPPSYESLDAVVDDPSIWSWLIFTSTNGVDSFFARLFEKGRDTRALGSSKIAAVGSATAERLRAFGIVPDVVPEKFQASAILPLLPQNQYRVRTAIVRAKEGREELIEQLRSRGGEVHLAVAYETRASQFAADELRQLVAADAIDCVTFTSGSTVKNFFGALTGEEKAKLAARAAFVSIGPSTSATLSKSGISNAIEAKVSTVEGIVEAIVEHFARVAEHSDVRPVRP